MLPAFKIPKTVSLSFEAFVATEIFCLLLLYYVDGTNIAPGHIKVRKLGSGYKNGVQANQLCTITP